jgi:hypothetical protein
MIHIMNYPLLVLVIAGALFWGAAMSGAALSKRRQGLKDESRDDFNVILGATLTLLGLIIGFTFSMAVSRYDQRKNYEEEEANAIGTEYLRADLLPDPGAEQVHALLRAYIDQRVLFYTTRSRERLQKINIETARLQNDMWSAVKTSGSSQPSPLTALAVGGMNDVLNSQGYTQAAWWNRIPVSAWTLMATIAVFANVLVGYGAKNFKSERFLAAIMPILLAVSFFLISDIDAPRGGVIRVKPQNLISLAESLRTQSDGH